MALKSLFDTLKKGGYIVKDLDLYLMNLSNTDSDRAINVNAPSQISNCMRANFYLRKGYEKDPNCVDARARRIFDNGTHVHLRLQEYLKEEGILLMDEVPLRENTYKIQGHTDGLLKLSDKEIGILEIKSINDRSFSALIDAKEEHKEQAMTYIFCAENRRRYLKSTYKNFLAFKKSEKERKEYYRQLFDYMKDGHKYTREEKINNQVSLGIQADNILYKTKTPITKVIFLYENKNSQELKEFTVEYDEAIMNSILERCKTLNEMVENDELPEREGTNKNTPPCKWCDYRIECFN